MTDAREATPVPISARTLASLIDHTCLRPEATRASIETLCREAAELGFGAVCVNPCWVRAASRFLDGTRVKVCGTAGFPLGASRPDVKALEAKRAVDDGASEIDMVANIGKLLSGTASDLDEVGGEIENVVAQAAGAEVKVILEVGLLDAGRIAEGCRIAFRSGARFVKTSTGFGPPFTLDHVRLMRRVVGPSFGLKAAGGIRTYEAALAALDAGANRIGTSSGVLILNEARREETRREEARRHED